MQWQITSNLLERALRPKASQELDETGACLNENAHSTKVVKIIQSYVGIINKMVWRKNWTDK